MMFSPSLRENGRCQLRSVKDQIEGGTPAVTISSRNTSEDVTRRQTELDLLSKLRRPQYEKDRPGGVLLSNWIQYYVDHFDLIKPFEEKQLKRAGYELSVGNVYSIAGKTHEIIDQPGQNELRIEPFEVAIIQTRERVNLPDFVIGRWNIRVRLAYQGLLWVGGPQVDPGYQGFLFCPIYNLSDQPVTLHFGDELALIDFVTTTPPTEQTKPYPQPGKRSRLLFEDYGPDKLQSALATRAERRVNEVAGRVESLQSRFDTYAQLTFAVLAVLFAVVSLSLGKPTDFSLLNPSLLLSGLSIFGSVLAIYYVRSGLDAFRRNDGELVKSPGTRLRPWQVVLCLAVLLSICLAFYAGTVRPLNARIGALEQEVKRLDQTQRSNADSGSKGPSTNEKQQTISPTK